MNPLASDAVPVSDRVTITVPRPAAVAAPATQVKVASLAAVIEVHGTPTTETCMRLSFENPLPDNVRVAPPAIAPTAGLTEVNVGVMMIGVMMTTTAAAEEEDALSGSGLGDGETELVQSTATGGAFSVNSGEGSVTSPDTRQPPSDTSANAKKTGTRDA